MPSVGERITTFKQFAESSLEEIYGERLGEAYKVTANHSESGVWINRSQGGELAFEWRPFPRLAQIAPVYGVTACDFDADGHLDLHLVQNFYSNQVETGLWRSGLSQLLKGAGDGSFRCVPPAESGLVIADDGKASTLCDFDGDGQPDIVASQNDGPIRSFALDRMRGGVSDGVALRLVGRAGNPQAVGARISADYGSGGRVHRAIVAGGGYLSQGSSLVFLPLRGLESFSIAWPDGGETRHSPGKGESPTMSVAQPAAER